MQKGDKGDDVKLVQSYLNLIGYNIKPDGVFGSITESVVKKFQQANAISITGIVDDLTLTVLSRQVGVSGSSNQSAWIYIGIVFFIGVLWYGHEKYK